MSTLPISGILLILDTVYTGEMANLQTRAFAARCP